MIKVIGKIIFIFGFLFMGELCFAQEPGNHSFEAEVFSGENGLSSSRITVNFVDSRGYLWIGTVDGLNRYDGYDYIIFKHTPGDSLSISNNHIRCIEEDSNGDLWVGTEDGLNIFDREQGYFQEFELNYPEEEVNKCTSIDAIIIPDSLGFWVQIKNSLKRISLIDHSVRSFPFYGENCNTITNYNSSGLAVDDHGFIWLGTNRGLFNVNTLDESYQHFIHNPQDPYSLTDNNVNDIYKDINDEIWIGTDNGLNKFDRLNNRFISYSYEKFANDSKFQISKIFEAEDGTIWLATEKGLAYLNKSSKSINVITEIIFQKKSNNLSSIKTLVIDKNNIVWMGSDIGLFKLDLKPRKFDVISDASDSRLSPSKENVSAIFKDLKDRLWIGSEDGSLEMIDTKNDRIKYFNLGDSWAKTIFEDNKGRIWIGSTKGIYLYSIQQQKLVAFEDFFISIVGSDLSNLSISQIIQSNREDFWIGTNKGIFHFRERIKMVDSYNTIYNDQISVTVGPVHSICGNNENEIWIGTQKGILVFNTQTNVFYKPILKLDDNSIFGEAVIYSIYLDKDKNCWVGTNYGLLCTNTTTGKTDHYTEQNGLPNNSVFKLLEDKESNIWFSTNRGLVKFDKSKNDILRYGLNDGLMSNEYNPGVGTSSYDGELFFGGLKGMDRFYPNKLIDYNQSPKVLITVLEVYGQNVLKKQLIDENTHSVKVRYNETFNLHFSVMDFSFPEQNRYMYSITDEGKREEWLQIGTQKSLTFSNLPSGTYIFKLRGSSGNGIWSESEASLKIIVEAPFWKTSIAYFSYGISILMLFYLFIQLRTSSLRKSNRTFRENEFVAMEVSRQKELLSDRNKNIEDSLHYAQKIQEAILVTREKFNQILPNSFILLMPKDIVSGDFYWISEKNNKVFVAAIDCTGHGVPGAFMSLIGLELFRKISNLSNVDDPGTFLNHMNDNIQEIFGKGGNISLRDGMDLSFCIIDKEKMMLHFAGAMNPLFLIRNDKLIEVKGDRFSIGADMDPVVVDKKKFTSHELKLQKNDMIYMFSDGFADQFGGPAGKKYKYRRFRHLLLTIYNIDIDRQKRYLEESIADWMGNEEQIDDILVIGIKADFSSD